MGQFDKYTAPGKGGQSVVRLPFADRPEIVRTETSDIEQNPERFEETSTGVAEERRSDQPAPDVLERMAAKREQDKDARLAKRGLARKAKRERVETYKNLATTTMRMGPNGKEYDLEDLNRGTRERVANRVVGQFTPEQQAQEAAKANRRGEARARLDRIKNTLIGKGTKDTAANSGGALADTPIPEYDSNGELNYPYNDPSSPASTTYRLGAEGKLKSGEKVTVSETGPARVIESGLNQAYRTPKGDTVTAAEKADSLKGQQFRSSKDAQLDKLSTDAERAVSEEDVETPLVGSSGSKQREAASIDEEDTAAENKRNLSLSEDEESGSTSGVKEPKNWSEQNLWDENGNLKDEYNLSNNAADPLSTTTMRMRDISPGIYRSPKHKRMHKARQAAFAEMNARHEDEISKEGNLSDSEQEAAHNRRVAERSEFEQKHAEPAEGYFRDNWEDREMVPNYEPGDDSDFYEGKVKEVAKPIVKEPRLTAKNVVNRSTASEPGVGRTFESVEVEDQLGRPETLEEENARVRKRRMPGGLGTHDLNLNETTAGRPPAKTSERNAIETGRMINRANAGTEITTMEPHVIDRAKRLSARLAPDLPETDSGHPNHPAFARSDYAKMAFVMNHAGIPETRDNGDYNHLTKFLGTNSSNFSNNLEYARQVIDNKKRFQSGKMVEYHPNNGNVDVATDFFRHGNEVIPLSDMSHPHNPLRNGPMRGSESPFMGFNGDSRSQSGIKPTAKGKIGKGVDWLHEGWHPYKDQNGNRVFENHSVSGATHIADLVTDSIKRGRSFGNMMTRLKRGSEMGFRSGENKRHISQGPIHRDGKPVDMEAEHQTHVAGGTNNPQCPECVKLASAASRKRGQEAAASFDPLRQSLLEEGKPPLAASNGVPGKTLSIQVNGENKVLEGTEPEAKLMDTVKPSDDKFILPNPREVFETRKKRGNNKPDTSAEQFL